jgi:hypothetical protein
MNFEAMKSQVIVNGILAYQPYFNMFQNTNGYYATFLVCVPYVKKDKTIGLNYVKLITFNPVVVDNLKGINKQSQVSVKGYLSYYGEKEKSLSIVIEDIQVIKRFNMDLITKGKVTISDYQEKQEVKEVAAVEDILSADEKIKHLK